MYDVARGKLNLKRVTQLIGQKVILKELEPVYFPYIIRWRNDKALNQFLNQSEELTAEKERDWYEHFYLKDNTQGLLFFTDKNTGEPFATLGWTDLDLSKRRCIMGRLLLGNPDYRNSSSFLEGFFLLSDYLYQFVDVMYIHVVKENKKALRLNKLFGYVPNLAKIQYPQELLVNNLHQQEFYRTKEMYGCVRKHLYEELQNELF